MKQLLFYFFILSFNLHAQTWHAMGGGLTTGNSVIVQDIDCFQGKIICTGYFKKAGPVNASSIATWDGIAWSNMGIGLWQIDTTLPAIGANIEIYKDDLYVTGSFTAAGGSNYNDTSAFVRSIAKWDGTIWHPITTGVNAPGLNSTSYDMCVYNNILYLGGYFNSGLDSTGWKLGTGILNWNDTSFNNIGNLAGNFPPNSSYAVLAFTEYQDKLIMGGYFTSIDGSPFGSYSGIAAWNDTAWSALGGGFNDAVFALAVYNGTLYAGGKFTATADNLTPLNHIAKWNGTQWLPVGEGFNGDVYAICGDTLTNNLYAGGSFTQTGTGFPANHISRWNGTFWQELYYGTNDDVYALYAKDSNLYVGGKFTQVGTGTTANCIAVWGYQAVGIEEQESKMSVQVFPNPSSGQLFLKIQTDYKGEGVFRIFDVMGRNIINCPIISDKELQQFDLKDLNNGIYIYQIEIDGIKKDSDRLIIIK